MKTSRKSKFARKLTTQQAETIAYLLSTSDYTQEQIAKFIGCHQTNVSHIAVGRTWSETLQPEKAIMRELDAIYLDSQRQQTARFDSLFLTPKARAELSRVTY